MIQSTRNIYFCVKFEKINEVTDNNWSTYNFTQVKILQTYKMPRNVINHSYMTLASDYGRVATVMAKHLV